MISGVLNIYKEKGYTSNDVVACLRRIVGQKKIGHTGTLDPDAEGVLPVCLGRATKLCDMLTDRNKTYEAVLLLGKTTDTQDISGTVLKECDTSGISDGEAAEHIYRFVGEYDQIPPMYSALKVNGKKLYELAREGKTVERKSRRVHVFQIRILEMKLPRIRMEVECSKGTYIRTLCHDIGESLGAGGCMESLKRTRSGRFVLEDSVKLAQVEEWKNQGRLMELVIPADEMFPDQEAVTLKESCARTAYNGGAFSPACLQNRPQCNSGEMYRVYDDAGRFIAIYRYDGEKRKFLPEKMFLDPEEIRAEKTIRDKTQR